MRCGPRRRRPRSPTSRPTPNASSSSSASPSDPGSSPTPRPSDDPALVFVWVKNDVGTGSSRYTKCDLVPLLLMTEEEEAQEVVVSVVVDDAESKRSSICLSLGLGWHAGVGPGFADKVRLGIGGREDDVVVAAAAGTWVDDVVVGTKTRVVVVRRNDDVEDDRAVDAGDELVEVSKPRKERDGLRRRRDDIDGMAFGAEALGTFLGDDVVGCDRQGPADDSRQDRHVRVVVERQMLRRTDEEETDVKLRRLDDRHVADPRHARRRLQP
mmetsp:Transcript_8729/g.22277  ORF Transcript_8729/g.22277 Transcript_8729/m.22277 type:complete len:269 (-) Transcript_8729:211-1017(-)